MEKSETTHLAVGATLLGVGGVALSIILPLAASTKPHPWTATWFLAAFSVAAFLGLLGAYTLCAVYTGWPLPQTASEREAARFEGDLGAFVQKGTELYRTPITSDAEFSTFEDDYWSWVDETFAWLTRSVSVSKAEAFAQPTGMAARITGSHNDTHNNLRLRLSWQLAILTALSAASSS